MPRLGRLLILVASPLWACAEARPCRAQSSVGSPRAGVLAAPTESPPAGVQDEPLGAPRLLSSDPPAASLKPAPLESSDLPLPINLAAALRLADARPLLVAAAQASAWVAEAQLERAKVIWVPTLNLGAAYVRHDGFGPDFNRGLNPPLEGQKIPLNQNVNWLYVGGGLLQSAYGPANLVTDTNSAPVTMRRPPNMTADMIFQPLAARQVLDSRKWDIQTAKNDVLLQTAQAYFRVHEFRGRYAGALDAVAKARIAVKRIDDMSKDLVPRAEVDRARRLQAMLEQKAAAAREAWRVSSADLTEILRLDPRVVVVPLEQDHLQITLIDPSRPVHELTLIALTSRPELASQKALIRAAEERIRREKWRPLLPNFFLNGFESPGMRIQAGALGTGRGSAMNLWSWRNDITPSIEWQIEQFGAGNLARVKEQRGEQSRAIETLLQIQDAVAADVTRSQAHLQSAAVRSVQAERELREALVTFEKNLQGLGQTQRFGNVLHLVYRPQEVVAALEHLQRSYDEYFSTVADYNRAQFEIFHALGYPADEVAMIHSAGDPAPVNTERPAFLPQVGVGPPPATR
ncbi:MAG: TolC family protein [Planctomycetes bacterium]|nr:TolC family protein [Planctomycetota bacterium]